MRMTATVMNPPGLLSPAHPVWMCAMRPFFLLTMGSAVLLIALWSAVRERQGDLALLRMLGAPPHRVALLVLAEALCLAALGAVLGLLAGHQIGRAHV